MQNWFSTLKRRGATSVEKLPLKRILRQCWTLLCVPIILYMRPWLEMLFGFYGAYAFLCLLPGFLTLIAFGLYRTERGSLGPVIIGLLCSLGFGATFTYSVAMQVVVPILPRNILEVFNFIERLEPLWPVIALSSLLSSLFIISHLIKYGLTQQKKVKQENSHGSARFATLKEIKAINTSNGLPIGCLLETDVPQDIDDLKEAIDNKASLEVVRQNPHHMVVIAPSGSGKGVGIVIPTLLEYEGPVLVTDIKEAENYHVTARYRKSLGREVYVFDPFKNTGHLGGSINILDFFDPHSEEIVDDAIMLASILIPDSEDLNSLSKYFIDQARGVLQALILYIVCSEDIEKKKKNLFEVYKLTCKSPQGFEEMLIEFTQKENLAYGVPARRAGALLSTKDGELSGTLNNINKELRFMDSPLVQKISATTTIDLTKLVQNEADLYLCIPLEKLKSYSRLIRLIIAMVFVMAQRHKRDTKKPLLMVLDEMSLLGSIPAVEEALIAGRAYKVKIIAISQTVDLLKGISPAKWKTFLANNLLLFFGLNELEESEYVSRFLGQTTIEAFSKNKGESHQQGTLKNTSDSKNEGESQSYQGRPVLTSDEIRFLDETAVLAFRKGVRPMLLKRIEYFKHPAWKGKYDKNPLES